MTTRRVGPAINNYLFRRNNIQQQQQSLYPHATVLSLVRDSSPFTGELGLAILRTPAHPIPSFPALHREDNTHPWKTDDRVIKDQVYPIQSGNEILRHIHISTHAYPRFLCVDASVTATVLQTQQGWPNVWNTNDCITEKIGQTRIHTSLI